MTEHMSNPALAEVDVEGMNRSSFLAKGALAVGAVYGMTMVGPFVRKAFSQGDMGDVEILNFALTLEYLEAAFYEQAQAEANLSGEPRQLVDLIAKDETAHVEALSTTISDLGGTPVEAPGVDFGNAFASEGSFLELAQTFEDTGVSAYNGAGPALMSKELLATAGQIVQVEARHAAAIRLLNGEEPAPVAFDETLDQQQVLKAVDPFVK
jgi:rubrerythrin